MRHSNFRRAIAPAVVIAASACAVGVAANAQNKATRPPSFTNEQADQGRAAYMQYCVDCHGANLNDGEFGGAPLKGLHFDGRWGGDTADVLYLYLSQYMPPDQPGRLNPKNYAAIMAFILRGNGYQPGGQELPADPDALGQVTLKR